jgi:hypothetical protein
MTIKDIFNREQWYVPREQDITHPITQYAALSHNNSLARIKGVVDERITKLDSRLEDYLTAYKDIMAEPCDGSDNRVHCTCVPALKLRVAELEAQNASLTETINAGTDHCDECGRKLRERIAELELRYDCCRDASTAKDLLIAELESKLNLEEK